ncbi:MAG: nickel-dependent hydrogenase large subunit, partial [Desulfobulbaceae bacterium]|nr:nickel-dependent hydrogenase large subunit [Desulfobulbaceae bacterium]
SVGGVTAAINPDNATTLNVERLFRVKELVSEVRNFIHQVYLPDVAAVGAFYKDWLAIGKGVTNYMAMPDMVLDTQGESFDLPGGIIMNGDLASNRAFTSFNDPFFKDNVSECIARSWYEGDWTKHPYDEETVPAYSDFQDDGKYSWLKAPRFQGEPMQVGPLAQVMLGYAQGHEPTKKYTDLMLAQVSSIAKVDVSPGNLHSTLGRHVARAVRTAVLADLALKHWQLLIDNIGRGDLAIFNKPTFPKGEQRGFGIHEAPRGALSHWIVIRDGKIHNYQCVVPSTWNAGPRDQHDKPGPYEASLLGNPVADPEQPLEVLRTIHSFDPCIACAVHMLDPNGTPLSTIKVL